MSSLQPVPGDRQLPRGHLLVLNRSFRRTLEAENKSPRTLEAYTDAVRLLATYCQAHGHRSSPASSAPGRGARGGRTLDLPSTSRMLGVEPDGSRRIQTEHLDDQTEVQGHRQRIGCAYPSGGSSGLSGQVTSRGRKKRGRTPAVCSITARPRSSCR
jgi:hypothetical protein